MHNAGEIPDAAALADGKTLWDYHRLSMAYGRADVILGLGSYDLAVASFAAELFLQGRASWLMFSGGVVARDDLLRTPWRGPEADIFAQRARDLGVPAARIVTEDQATNTGENFRLSLRQLRQRGIGCASLLVVTKPNMERRARATARVNLPADIALTVTSRPCAFETYPEEAQLDRAALINLMVGDLQRIELYPALGFQAAEAVPDAVKAAYQRLVAKGFTQHLMR